MSTFTSLALFPAINGMCAVAIVEDEIEIRQEVIQEGLGQSNGMKGVSAQDFVAKFRFVVVTYSKEGGDFE